MPPGVRSYAADRYDGFETSASRVLDAWQNEGEHADGDGVRDWQFDLVLGHSQGAAMVAALIALHRNPYHPRLGYIFNGVSFPNPYRTQITQENLNVVTEGDPPPRGLFVIGKTDEIVPNETAEELRDEMQKAGMDVQTIYHNGGHSIPSDVDAVESICQWLVSPFKTK
jgi:predicted esterase